MAIEISISWSLPKTFACVRKERIGFHIPIPIYLFLRAFEFQSTDLRVKTHLFKSNNIHICIVSSQDLLPTCSFRQCARLRKVVRRFCSQFFVRPLLSATENVECLFYSISSSSFVSFSDTIDKKHLYFKLSACFGWIHSPLLALLLSLFGCWGRFTYYMFHHILYLPKYLPASYNHRKNMVTIAQAIARTKRQASSWKSFHQHDKWV